MHLNPVSTFDHRGAAARLLAETIVKFGGVMITTSPRLSCRVVGHIAWLGPCHLFWHDADPRVGEPATHTLQYDALCRVAHRGVAFFSNEEIIGYLCTIETASIGNIARMRAAYRHWTEAPPPQDEVCEACELAHTVPGRRHCAWHLARCAHQAVLEA